MTDQRRSGVFSFFLILLFLVGIAILWVGIPLAAENAFGEPSGSLTGFQKWNYSFQLLTQKNDLLEPVMEVDQKLNFEITSGSSVNVISTGLEKQGLIRNSSVFRSYLIYKGYDSQIKAGIFQLSPADNALSIAEKIQAPYSDVVDFYIYPGWRAEEIAAALPTSGIEVMPEGFLTALKDFPQYSDYTMIQSAPSAEGFLFPGEYRISRQTSANELIKVFLGQFNENVNSDIIQSIEDNGLSFYDGIVLASIIQKETFQDDERAKIASVFYNRLSTGMKLETDPTVQYALGYSQDWGGWWKTPLQTSDLSVNSPYNTYRISGLPPTPISNPDLASILAVAFPEETPFFFFRARCDGSGYHDFSVTYEEHIAKGCQ